MEQLNFVKANPEHLEMLSAICEQTFRETYTRLNKPGDMDIYIAQNFSRQSLAREIAEQNSETWLVMNHNMVVAYFKITWQAPMLNIDRLYVLQSMQASGVGMAILKRIVEMGRALGATGISLAVWKRNEKAIFFYERCGFIQTGTTTFLLGTDLQEDFIMTRSI